MPAQLCVICNKNPVQNRCMQCHKAICNACAFKTENGAFCSRKCAATYKDFKEQRTAPARRPRSSLGHKFVVLVCLLIAAAVVAWFMDWIPESTKDKVKDTATSITEKAKKGVRETGDKRITGDKLKPKHKTPE